METLEDIENCKKCYFFFKKTAEGGDCRKNPPTPALVTSNPVIGPSTPGIISYWPPVQNTGWCGEYKNQWCKS